MQPLKLFDEKALMVELKDDTLELIHSTTVIIVIKKLIDVHDIVHLNLEICERFKSPEPLWDSASLSDLSMLRSEIVLFHRADFDPIRIVDGFANKIQRIVNCAKMRGLLK